MPEQTNIPDCIPPDRHPRKPNTTLPAGSIDTHVHVFDSRYPLSPARGYNPPNSTLDDLTHLHSTLGIDRVVFTQPSVYGTDNRAIEDGVASLNADKPDRARMVVSAGKDVSEAEIAGWDARGGRGIRLNLDNKGGMPLKLNEIVDLVAKLKPFGWHLEWLFPGCQIVELMPILSSTGIPQSIGHFAYQPASAGIGSPGFQALLELVREGRTWVKISGANRVSATDLPPYHDVEPMVHALIEVAADRIMWGTDWPHPNKFEVNPNDGDLVDAFGEWVRDDELRAKIMVGNPEAFYRF
ncbi:MAG: amidohydrolase family protein [Albidovulum sp.]|nr:amidohydrolase family protein [Albidovulum sp.]